MISRYKTLSIIVPVFNEAHHLEPLIHYLFKCPCPLKREWIFIDDGSTDGSLKILKRLKKTYSYQLIINQKNEGKGSSISKGIKKSNGEFIIIQDADFEYDPKEIPQLLEPLILNKADAVYGNRYKNYSYKNFLNVQFLGNKIVTTFNNICSGLNLEDIETGYKLFRTELIKSKTFKSKRFGIEIEVTSYLKYIKAQIVEVQISYHPRSRKQGKKLTWKDGFASLFHIIRFNFFTHVESKSSR